MNIYEQKSRYSNYIIKIKTGTFRDETNEKGRDINNDFYPLIDFTEIPIERYSSEKQERCQVITASLFSCHPHFTSDLIKIVKEYDFAFTRALVQPSSVLDDYTLESTINLDHAIYKINYEEKTNCYPTCDRVLLPKVKSRQFIQIKNDLLLVAEYKGSQRVEYIWEILEHFSLYYDKKHQLLHVVMFLRLYGPYADVYFQHCIINMRNRQLIVDESVRLEERLNDIAIDFEMVPDGRLYQYLSFRVGGRRGHLSVYDPQNQIQSWEEISKEIPHGINFINVNSNHYLLAESENEIFSLFDLKTHKFSKPLEKLKFPGNIIIAGENVNMAKKQREVHRTCLLSDQNKLYFVIYYEDEESMFRRTSHSITFYVYLPINENSEFVRWDKNGLPDNRDMILFTD